MLVNFFYHFHYGGKKFLDHEDVINYIDGQIAIGNIETETILKQLK